MPSLLERLRDAVAPAFTVDHEIGRGGMGIVFLGHDVALDRPVAIKVLQPELASRHAAAKLSHGDTAAAAHWGELVERAAPDHRGAARLARELAAIRAASRGRLDSALTLSAPLLAYDSTGVVDDPFARAVLHLERGRWLLALGDTAKADAELLWYENSDSGIEGWLHSEVQPGEVDAVASAVARRFRGRLAVARHGITATCRLAPRVAQLWAAAEPVYAALVGEARALGKGCGG